MRKDFNVHYCHILFAFSMQFQGKGPNQMLFELEPSHVRARKRVNDWVEKLLKYCGFPTDVNRKLAYLVAGWFCHKNSQMVKTFQKQLYSTFQ